MEELIKITEKDGKKAVSARGLHQFLGSKRDFSNWIKDRIRKYGLVEDQDYTRFAKNVETTGGRSLEYALTIDCAKELSMVEANAKGQQARQYFIACENRLKEAVNSNYHIPTSYSEALLLASRQAEQLELQEVVIKEQAPKVEYHDRVLNTENAIAINVIAKELGTSAQTLNKRLNQLGVIYKSNEVWVLYSRFQDKGYTKSRTYTYQNSIGEESSSISMQWTQAGRKFIHELIKKNGL